MSNSEFLYHLIFGLSLVLSVTFFVMGRCTMRPRIKADLTRQGFRIISIKQKVMGIGWLTYKSPNIFTVRYIDCQGNEHQTDCEPNLLWGTTWSNDIIVNYAHQNSIDGLIQTRKRLETELQRIEQQHQFEIDTLTRRKAFLLDELTRESKS